MIEVVSAGVTASGTRVALFDFDGTLSLIRSGWMDVMVPMMVELLSGLKTGEKDSELKTEVEEFVARLTGKQTIYQMIELADRMERRGGAPEDPLVYKRMYLDRLWTVIKHRVDELRSGHADPNRYLVPGSRELLEGLLERGYKLLLASGTDDPLVQEEARLLDVHRYFSVVHGALDDYQRFSKALMIQHVIESAEFSGEQFLGFGDGYVEVENVKQVGGIAVGVASDEPECRIVDEWKRARLIGVGADFIVPNYLEPDALFDTLFAPAEVRS